MEYTIPGLGSANRTPDTASRPRREFACPSRMRSGSGIGIVPAGASRALVGIEVTTRTTVGKLLVEIPGKSAPLGIEDALGKPFDGEVLQEPVGHAVGQATPGEIEHDPLAVADGCACPR